MATQPNPGQGKLAKAAGGVAIATLLLSSIGGFEGDKLKPYKDIVGRWTVCNGETNVPMRAYTEAECKDMLASELVRYVNEVHAATPGVQGNQLVAATSLEYNVGAAAYARSSVARLFNAGRVRAACDAFLRFSYAGGRQVAGLLRRREQERAICLKGVP